jgi:UDP-glucose 4-epimerase
MHYLITGGAGFIGGHLAETLIHAGHQVTVIDDLSTGQLSNIDAIKEHKNFRFITGDILNYPQLDELVEKCDTVFHLAAAVGVELVVHDPVRTIETNVHGTERVLKPAARYNKKIIVASTSEVYGKSTREKFSETDDLLIGSPYHSRWSYACSKLIDEFFIMAYHSDAGLRGTIVRFFNTVGPRQTGRYGMVIPRFVAAALKGEPLKVFGNGDQTRCFCHVFDTIRALVKLADNEASSGKIFNIGNTHRISINKLAEQVISQLNSSSTIVHIPYEEAYEKGFEDMLHRAPDIRLIKEFSGWKPELSLEKIITDVAQYQRETLKH